METQLNKSEKKCRKASMGYCALFFLFMVPFTINVLGDTISAKNSSPAGKDSNNSKIGDSRQVWNGTAWVDAVQENDSAAVAKLAKEEAHQALMNYIYMGLGLVVIFGASWFAVVGKKGKGGHEGEEKSHVVKHHHSTFAKKYGTGKARG
jgi:hypothetical protein